VIKNIIYFISSLLIFFSGIVLYGIILNIREVTLQEAIESSEIINPTDISIIIDRRNYQLHLYSGEKIIKSYKAVFGRNDSPVKENKNDYVTPSGTFIICSIDSGAQFYKQLKLNYPNESIAAESLKKKYISREDFRNIVNEVRKGNCPPDNTVLGSNISIHGIGTYNFIFKNLPFVFNWTDGSIAISDESIDELLTVVKAGTKVEIKN
jgi:murein L,D-transpeptidase YafK